MHLKFLEKLMLVYRWPVLLLLGPRQRVGLYGLHRAAGGLAPLGPRYGTGILWAYMFKSIYIPPVNCLDILLFVCSDVLTMFRWDGCGHPVWAVECLHPPVPGPPTSTGILSDQIYNFKKNMFTSRISLKHLRLVTLTILFKILAKKTKLYICILD